MVRVEGVGVGAFVDGETEGEEEGELLGRWDGGMGVLGRVVGLEEEQERAHREREERAKDELEGEQVQQHVGSGLEVSRGDLSKGHLSRVEVDKGKGKEKERKDSLPEEDIGEG